MFDENNRLIKIVRLTRKEYYHKAKINVIKEESIKFNLRIKEILEEMAIHHFKTSNMKDFRRAFRVVLKHWDPLWKNFLSKCYASNKFYLMGTKRSVLRETVNKLDSPDEPIRCGYGDGNFGAGKKGEEYVPVKTVKDVCSRVLATTEVDEWGSSTACPQCESQLFVVFNIHNGFRYEIRGLKW